jgi:nicotinate-nucleotide adenylyltransferase
MSKNERIGIFGGTFNPVHLGHINSALTVSRKLKLDTLFIVPAHENPLKRFVEGPTAEQRLEMVRIGFEGESDKFQVDDQEIRRPGPSFTIETIRNYLKSYAPEQLYLVLGADHLYTLHRWKEFDKILESCNVVFTSRPGSDLPRSVDEFPDELKPFIDMFEKGFVQLKTGRYIEFVQLEDMPISASDVRKKIRTGQNVHKLISTPVEGFIREHQLYGPLQAKIGDFQEFSKFCEKALDARKALNIQSYDLRKISAPSEFAIITSGTSTRHASSLAENLIRDVKEEFGVLPQGLEGLGEGRWVLIDYGALIVHVFYDYVRTEYKLEELWRKQQA